jgi:hypothetical protein
MLGALLLLAACAPAPQPGLTAEEEAALNAAFDLLAEDEFPLSESQLEIYPEARGMPADVQRFIVRWQDCRHWLGEIGWDEQRRRQIEQAVGEVCPGTDALAERLRARYADNPEVLARLAEFEPLDQ